MPLSLKPRAAPPSRSLVQHVDSSISSERCSCWSWVHGVPRSGRGGGEATRVDGRFSSWVAWAAPWAIMPHHPGLPQCVACTISSILRECHGMA